MIASLSAKDDELKKMLQEVRQTEERFRTLFESAPIGFALIETSGRILEANDAMYRLLGFKEDQTDGALRFKDYFYRTEDAERFGGELFKTPSLSKFECDLVRPDGQRWTARLTASSFTLAGESLMLVIAEDASRELKLVAQLQRAQKMEAIGTLAGGVAHDLNNILSGIVSYPELLLMDLDAKSPLIKPILTIQKSGEKAAAIVQDLLTLARRGVAATEVVHLNSIISEYLLSPEHEKLLMDHPDVKMKHDLDANLLNIMGSPVHLSKSIMNLVSNAAEAMPEGGTITIRSENRHADNPINTFDDIGKGDYVCLTVADTGIDISPEDMERIFEPFYTKKSMGRSGTGLGMAVVWGTVKDHRGYIDIKSREGNGTTITLYFPVTRKELAAELELASLEEIKGNGESILVIDDVLEQRQIASEMLEKLGYAVTTVASGEEAVDYLVDHSADLIVLDMIMDPGIDGLETYKRILKLHPGQRSVIASGYSESDRVKEAQKIGAGVYIKKPYLIEKFGRAVRKELEA
jgi:PAS domain S-box-containing protein